MSYPRRIMVVGNGGRECTLASTMLLSPDVEQLYIAPVNWGVLDPHGDKDGASRVIPLDIAASDIPAIVAAAAEHRVDLVVIGPEDPLVNGLADELRANDIPVVGPGRDAAQLEGSKQYAKDFMLRHGLPTAEHLLFSDADALLEYCESSDRPVVLKADGLAAGKGVIVCNGSEDALAGSRRLMVEREFGAAGDLVLVEERLFGLEVSWTCLVCGGEGMLLAASTDYKPLLDDNQGPNTGGMGNICPTPNVSDEVTREFHEQVLTPFLAGLKADGIDYRGFLFVGTMITREGLKVLEFNVRLGDPEAQVVMPLRAADWPQVFADLAKGNLVPGAIEKRDGACIAVVVATENYPYGKSEPAVIEGLDRVRDQGLLACGDEQGHAVPPPVSIYFAGVSRELMAEASADANAGYSNYYDQLDRARFMASGGRVLAVSAHGSDLSEARRLAYEVLGNIHFNGMKFRSDIGKLR
jgi:phosphoribosylamine--glycine ligase